jgi:multicomponent Na+:H+ antiporter subunit D
MQKYAFYGQESGKRLQQVREVSATMIFSMITLGILCFLLSLLVLPSMREAILQPAIDILMNADIYTSKIIGM